MKIYVGNLPDSTNDADLEQLGNDLARPGVERGEDEQRLETEYVARYLGPCDPLPVPPEMTGNTNSAGLALFPNALSHPACARLAAINPNLPPGITPVNPLGVALPQDSGVPVG